MSNPLGRLRQFIVESYDLEELRTLCFNLGINYDDLRGEALSGKTRELLLKVGRQRRLDELLTVIAGTRPEWSEEEILSTTPAALEALYAALASFADIGLPAPPAPGEIPRATSGWPKTAPDPATLRSQARDSSHPPPRT